MMRITKIMTPTAAATPMKMNSEVCISSPSSSILVPEASVGLAVLVVVIAVVAVVVVTNSTFKSVTTTTWNLFD